MKKIILIVFVIALIFCACAAPAQTDAEPEAQQQSDAQVQAAETGSEQAPPSEVALAFDLDAYKSAVDQFRRSVMDNSINLGNMAKYEINYMEAITKIRGSIDADETVESAYEWLETESGVSAADIKTANETIRKEYADLIIAEIEGKEAEELDSYVRSMYENYTVLYKAATSASPADAYSFASAAQDALTEISTANDNISLFCGDYEE